MSSVITSNVTSGFIDLATFDEIEKYMYGGPDATAYFVRETRKSTWFTQVPVALSRAAGNPEFGQDWSVSISRAGDYLLQTWLRLNIPSVTTASVSALFPTIKWTRNLMHNLVRDCTITFNDLVAARFDSYHLDFWASFTVPASKQAGYAQMIGNGFYENNATPVVPTSLIATVAPGGTLPKATLNLPLPFFYSRDSGVALPTAALPYNDMKINFSFRDWTELLVKYTAANIPGVPVASTDLTATPQISNCYVWANYAIVSNDERKRMACAPRDILIEQVQTAPFQTFSPATVPNPSYDIRFSHAVKVLFFAVRNTTCSSDWSNYTSYSTFSTAVNPDFYIDPIRDTSLIYENTSRLASMGSDYYNLINPYYNAPNIASTLTVNSPTLFNLTLHSYSYSLDFNCLDPMGSTNYGKLTNVSIVPHATTASIAANAAGSTQYLGQKYTFILTAVNNNIIRISGGALGFPVL